MQGQWRAFWIGLVFSFGYTSVCTYTLDSQQVARSQNIVSEAPTRGQWLEDLRFHTPFSFPQQLMQSPGKMHNSTPVSSSASDKNQHTQNVSVSSKNLTSALQKALGETVPETIKHWQPEATLSSSTGSPWAIQVATRASRELAEKLRQQLITKGHDTRIVQGYSPHSYEVEYHVRLHGFATQKQAQIYRQKFEKKEKGFASFCLQQPSVKRIP